MVIFRGFSKIFSNYWIAIKVFSILLIDFPNIGSQQKKIKMGAVLGQNLGQISRSNVVKEVMKQALSLGSFSNFTREMPFEAESSGCKTTCMERYGNYS